MTTTTPPRKPPTGATIFGLVCLGLFALCMLYKQSAPVQTAATEQPTSVSFQRYCTIFADTARAIAQEYRDHDVPKVTADVALELATIQEAQRRNDGALAISVADTHWMLEQIYGPERAHSPAQVSQAILQGCLRRHQS